MSKHRMPIALVCATVLGWGSGLVSGSATFASVCILQSLISPDSTNCRISWYLLSMCLFFWCHLGSLACAIAPELSQYTSNGLDKLGTTPRSIRNFLIHTPSFAASEAAMYSASVVESATVSCLELFQLTAPPFKVNTYPDCERDSSKSVWKLASV